jgi:hypothetical protein
MTDAKKQKIKKKLKKRKKQRDKEAAVGGLGGFLKGKLNVEPEEDIGQAKGGLGAFITGKLRHKPDKDVRTGGLRDWLSGKLDVALMSRDVVDDEIAELENHIEHAKNLPSAAAKRFIKDAYELRDKLKNLQIDTEDLAAQANIKDMIDGFKIDHTNLRERITGEKDEIEEEKQGGFAAFIRGDLREDPELGKKTGGLRDWLKGSLEEYRQELHDWPRQDIDREIDALTAEIKQAGRIKGANAGKFLEEAYALREKLKDSEAFENTEPSEEDLGIRAQLQEDIRRFNETFKEVRALLAPSTGPTAVEGQDGTASKTGELKEENKAATGDTQEISETGQETDTKDDHKEEKIDEGIGKEDILAGEVDREGDVQEDIVEERGEDKESGTAGRQEPVEGGGDADRGSDMSGSPTGPGGQGQGTMETPDGTDGGYE